MGTDMDARCEALKRGNGGKSVEDDAKNGHWINATAFICLVLILLTITALWVAAASRDVNQACFQWTVNEEHALMEASFQNPPEQDALAQAIRACSR